MASTSNGIGSGPLSLARPLAQGRVPASRSRSTSQPALPFHGRTPHSRHASYAGAVAASGGASSKRARYLEWLRVRGRATDEDAEIELGMRRSSVCSTRNGCVERGLVVSVGVTSGRQGRTLAVWALTQAGGKVSHEAHTLAQAGSIPAPAPNSEAS